MAILKLGPLIIGIRGTMGGATFSANKSGPYVKGWAQPPLPTRVRQSAIQTTFSQIAAAWVATTQFNRDAWDTWAAGPAPPRTNSLGETILLTGFNWFQSLNGRRVMAGFSIRELAPTNPLPAAPTITSVLVTESGGGASTVTYPLDEFDGFFAYYTVSMNTQPSGVSFNRPNYFPFIETAFGATSFAITSHLESIYGTIQLNRRWFSRVARVSGQGILGPFTNIRTDTIP